jgi:hypothetical protein
MKKHRFWACAALLVTALMLTACGQAAVTDVTKMDPDALLKEVKDKYGNMNSYNMSMDMRMDMTVSAEGQSARIVADITMDMASIEKPAIKAKTDMAMGMTMTGLGADDTRQSASYVMYAMEENGKIVGYISTTGDESLSVAPFKNGEVLGDAADYAELSAVNDFEYLTQPKVIGAEKLDGRDAIHLQAKMDAQKAFSEASALTGEEIMDESSMGMVLPILQSLNADLWIDAATHKPLKLTAELGDDLESLLKMLEPLMQQEGADVAFNALVVNITITDFDAVQDFEVPQELKSKPNVTPGPASDT